MEYIKKFAINIKKRRISGSTVIEMSYIMPVFFGLFVLIIYTVFYFHDKAVLNGAAGETAILGVQAERKGSAEYDLEEFFRDRTDGKLIYMTDADVSVSRSEDEITVSVSAKRTFMRIKVSQTARCAEPEKNIRRMGGEK